MTPTQLEHLKLIDAHLERLLAIAEKRTPGEWYESQHRTAVYGMPNRSEQIAYTGFPNGDAAFIASCAGNAESGWMATRAAIHQGTWLMEMDQMGRLSLQDQGATHQMLTDILAAFPLELVQPCIGTP